MLSVIVRSSLAKVAAFSVTPVSFQPSATSPWRIIKALLAVWMNANEKEPDEEAIVPSDRKGRRVTGQRGESSRRGRRATGRRRHVSRALPEN